MNLINVENMFPVPKNLLLLCVYRFLFGGAVTQWKVGGSIPGYSSLHGKVSLDNLLNPPVTCNISVRLWYLYSVF